MGRMDGGDPTGRWERQHWDTGIAAALQRRTSWPELRSEPPLGVVARVV
jgi:hypothetical protein